MKMDWKELETVNQGQTHREGFELLFRTLIGDEV